MCSLESFERFLQKIRFRSLCNKPQQLVFKKPITTKGMSVKQILYTAVDNDGQDRSGYVEARNNQEALEVLSDQGLSEISFFDDASLAISRDNLAGLGEREIEAMSRLEVRLRKSPRFSTFIIEVIKLNRFIVNAGIALLLWGLYDQNRYLILIGAAIAMAMPLVATWNYRVVANYDKFLSACALGDWDTAISLCGKLRDKMKSPEMAFDLDVRLAGILAAQGSLEPALQSLEKWRHEFDSDSPGMYESRVAIVFHAAGRYEDFLQHLRDAYFKSAQSQTIVLDLALAEARLGDPEKAAVLLKTVKTEELPVYGFGFIEWAQGMIDSRTDSGEPELHLSLALSALLEFAETPAVWPSLAVCTGDYALCMRGSRSTDEVGEMLSKVWKIICVQGEKDVVEKLAKLYPNLE